MENSDLVTGGLTRWERPLDLTRVLPLTHELQDGTTSTVHFIFLMNVVLSKTSVRVIYSFTLTHLRNDF